MSANLAKKQNLPSVRGRNPFLAAGRVSLLEGLGVRRKPRAIAIAEEGGRNQRRPRGVSLAK